MNQIKIPKYNEIYKVEEAFPLFQTLVGSRAYGMSRDESDYDYRAAHVFKPDYYITVDKKQNPTIEVKYEPIDAVSHELGHFLYLMKHSVHNVYEMIYSPYFEWYASEELKKEFTALYEKCFNPYLACLSYIGAMASAISGLAKAFEETNAEKAVKCFFLHHRLLASYTYVLRNKDDKKFPPLNISELHSLLGDDIPTLPSFEALHQAAKHSPTDVIGVLCEHIDDLKKEIETSIKDHKPVLIAKANESELVSNDELNNFYRKAVYELSKKESN